MTDFHADFVPLQQLDGVLVLNKPSGPTSKRCLGPIKRMGQKKIGHAGTLDPMASGVLLVLLGQATKLSGYLLDGGLKVYSGEFLLGRETDTWDAEGQVVEERDPSRITPEEVTQAVASWVGRQDQTVPPYSAAKHGGKPLYKLAREGKPVPEKVKQVEILQAEILSMELPSVRFRVKCSSGTYIRSLAHSLGMRLGCGAVLTELTREYSHPFGLDKAVAPETLEDAPETLPQYVRPISEALCGWPVVGLSPEDAQKTRNGMPIDCPPRFQADIRANDDLALLAEGDAALAIARLLQTPSGPRLVVARGLWN